MFSIRVFRSVHLRPHSPLVPILTFRFTPVARPVLLSRCATNSAFPNEHLVFNQVAEGNDIRERTTEEINVQTAETVVFNQNLTGPLPVLTNLPHTLRPYQQECIDVCLKLYQQGIRRQVVSLPVGSGKTVIFANLITSLSPPTYRSTKSLVLAHREELLEQARKQILRVNPGLVVELDQGDTQATLHPEVDVVVASVSSLGRKSSNRLEKYDPAEFKAIIIDEAHHASAESYLRILKHFGVYKSAETEANTINEAEAMEHEEKGKSKILVWGCSATVRRHDGIGLATVFDHIAYTKSFLGMIEEGWLCDMRVSTVETAVDLSNVKISKVGGDFREAELSMAVNIAARNEAVVKAWLNFAWSPQASPESMNTPSSLSPSLITKSKQRRSTLAFAVDIKHVYDLTDVFRRLGIDARPLTSEMASTERHNLLNEFRAGNFPVLVNCGILTEGTDIPQIDCVVLARPTRSATLFQQMIGRGMRLSRETGKVDCLMLDFVDNFKRAGNDGLITIPTLLGLSPDTILKDYVPRNTDRAIVSDNSLEDLTHGTAEINVTTYISPEDFLGYNSDSNEIRDFSKLSWISIPTAENKDYVLSLFNGITIRLSMDKTGIWTARLRRKITADGETIYCKPCVLPMRADTLQMAIKGTETWLQSQPQGHIAMKIANKMANWRKAPATNAQQDFLSKVFKFKDMDMKKLKKGEAADLITQYREGKAKFLKESAKKNTQAIVEEQMKKERLQNIRGLVTVGPLNTEKTKNKKKRNGKKEVKVT